MILEQRHKVGQQRYCRKLIRQTKTNQGRAFAKCYKLLLRLELGTSRLKVTRIHHCYTLVLSDLGKNLIRYWHRPKATYGLKIQHNYTNKRFK